MHHAPAATAAPTRQRPACAAPRRPRPAREPSPPYPELPETPHNSGGRVTHNMFRRAVFLRSLAEHRAFDAFFWKTYEGKPMPLQFGLLKAGNHLYQVAGRDFHEWMERVGGLAPAGEVRP